MFNGDFTVKFAFQPPFVLKKTFLIQVQGLTPRRGICFELLELCLIM